MPHQRKINRTAGPKIYEAVRRKNPPPAVGTNPPENPAASTICVLTHASPILFEIKLYIFFFQKYSNTYNFIDQDRLSSPAPAHVLVPGLL